MGYHEHGYLRHLEIYCSVFNNNSGSMNFPLIVQDFMVGFGWVQNGVVEMLMTID